MKKLTGKELQTKEIAAIEAALAETRADIAVGRVFKGSVASHLKRVKEIAAQSSKMQMK